MGRVVGLILAVVAHALILLFGGIFFLGDEDETARKKIAEVEILAEERKDEAKEPRPERAVERTIEETRERPPGMAELVRLQEQAAVAAAPSLAALSLEALEGILDPAAAAGEFAIGGSLESGGRIGGAGAPGAEGAGELETVFGLSDLDQRPRPIAQRAPVYPQEMRRNRIEGTVNVLFVVDQDGRVVDPRVETSSHQAFEAPALEAVRQWRFEPAVRGGQKVKAKMRAPIRFAVS
jgi:protein TonB